MPIEASGSEENLEVTNNNLINGYLETKYENNTLKYKLRLHKDIDNRRIYASFENLNLSHGSDNDCISETANNYSTHFISPQCSSLSLNGSSRPAQLIENGVTGAITQDLTGFIRLKMRFMRYTKKKLVIRDDKVFVKSGWYATSSSSEALNMTTGNEIQYVGNSVLFGDWNKQKYTVNEDTVIVYSIDKINDTKYKNVSIPTDDSQQVISVIDFSVTEKYDLTKSYRHLASYIPDQQIIFLGENARRKAYIHEYSHSQQNYAVSKDMKWLVEATATYDANVQSYEEGEITSLSKWFSVSKNGSINATLSRPNTWSTITPYSKGQSIISGIRSCTDKKTVEEIESQLRRTQDTIDYSRFVEIANSTTEGNLTDWLYERIHTNKTIKNYDSVSCWS
jgi:hypothetical protein